MKKFRLTFLVAAGSLMVAASGLAQQFSDVTDTAGMSNLVTRAWGNPLWGDLNNDGFLDLIVPIHELDYMSPNDEEPSPKSPFVYINNQDGTFTNKGEASGLTGQGNPNGVPPSPDNKDWLGLSLGDYNGDGNLDFFAAEPPFQSSQGDDGSTASPTPTPLPTRNALYKGKGDGTFTYTADIAGLELGRNYGETGFFMDYNNDGKLDLFVKNLSTNNEPSVNVLYKSNGNGTFSKVAGAAGLETAIENTSTKSGPDVAATGTLGTIVSFADYDNDGNIDVVMGGNGAPEALFRNVGGTFSEVTTEAGLKKAGNTTGLAWGDYDNDGLLDLYISRGEQNGMGKLGNSLYRNNGNGTFSDVTTIAGVNDNTNTWASVWGDYDNDGFLDLFVTRPGTTVFGPGNANILYHNNGDGTFTDVAPAEGAGGLALEDGLRTSAHKLAAWGDYNNDGFLDLVIQDGIAPTLVTMDAAQGIHHLFKNNGNSNHYIKVNLKGTLSNLRGIGARVTVTYGNDGVAFRENNGGGGGEYASQGSEPLHFGIGTATVATVKVNWPNGVVDTRTGVAADVNQPITIVEGESGGPTPTPTPTPSPTVPPGKLLNISTRVQAQTGEKVLIGGFIITGGGGTKKVILRAIGPSLADGNPPITGVLADPALELHLPDGTVVSNNNWRVRQEDQILASGVAPTNDLEAAIVAELSPVDPTIPGSGQYTAVVSGHDGGSGVALVEVYDLDDPGTSLSELANISTRGFVGTFENVMIGGIIIGADDQDGPVLIRALGPSLASDLITDPLADPTLELRDENAALIDSNDDWADTNRAAIEATELAPTRDAESAILATLPPGSYTAVVQGVGAATGVGLVEFYRLK